MSLSVVLKFEPAEPLVLHSPVLNFQIFGSQINQTHIDHSTFTVKRCTMTGGGGYLWLFNSLIILKYGTIFQQGQQRNMG